MVFHCITKKRKAENVGGRKDERTGVRRKYDCSKWMNVIDDSFVDLVSFVIDWLQISAKKTPYAHILNNTIPEQHSACNIRLGNCYDHGMFHGSDFETSPKYIQIDRVWVLVMLTTHFVSHIGKILLLPFRYTLKNIIQIWKKKRYRFRCMYWPFCVFPYKPQNPVRSLCYFKS